MTYCHRNEQPSFACSVAAGVAERFFRQRKFQFPPAFTSALGSGRVRGVSTQTAAHTMLYLSCIFFSLCGFALSVAQRDVSAIELGEVIADIAQHVADDGGYAVDFTNAFAGSSRVDNGAVSGKHVPPAFAGLETPPDAEVVTLQPAVETAEDVAHAAVAFESARASKRAASTRVYDADWQRMLDAEAGAIKRLLRAELVLSPGGASHGL